VKAKSVSDPLSGRTVVKAASVTPGMPRIRSITPLMIAERRSSV
jgi:hypothetical protein